MLNIFMNEYHTLQKGMGMKVKEFCVVALLVLFCTFSGKATNYYVSNSGNDSNAGTTPETAWQTINKVNKYYFCPG